MVGLCDVCMCVMRVWRVWPHRGGGCTLRLGVGWPCIAARVDHLAYDLSMANVSLADGKWLAVEFVYVGFALRLHTPARIWRSISLLQSDGTIALCDVRVMCVWRVCPHRCGGVRCVWVWMAVHRSPRVSIVSRMIRR